MTSLVSNVFKAIFMATLFVIIWDIGFYLFRVTALNHKIEAVMTTMQQEVTRNNYLPEEEYNMYSSILSGIGRDMNGVNAVSSLPHEVFVEGMQLNYDHDPYYITTQQINQLMSSGLTISKKLDTPAAYGDVQLIELNVFVHPPTWRLVDLNGAHNQTQRDIAGTKRFTYTYQVPCLRYISVTK